MCAPFKATLLKGLKNEEYFSVDLDMLMIAQIIFGLALMPLSSTTNPTFCPYDAEYTFFGLGNMIFARRVKMFSCRSIARFWASLLLVVMSST